MSIFDTFSYLVSSVFVVGPNLRVPGHPLYGRYHFSFRDSITEWPFEPAHSPLTLYFHVNWFRNTLLFV